MNNRAYALLTGLFVVSLIAAVVVVGIWMSGSHAQTRPYIVVTTGNVIGLQPQSQILFRGIASGVVSKIALDPADSENILIYLEVDKAVPVTRDTYATLRLQGITGLSQLELDNSPGPTSKQPLPTSTDAPGRIPMRPSLLDRLTDSGATLMAQLDKAATGLSDLLSTDNRDHMARLLAQADASSAMLVKLENDLDETARRLPALSKQSEATLSEIQHAAANVSTLSQNLNRLAGSGQATGAQLDAALAQITQTAADIHRLSENLRADPQQLLLGAARPAPGPGEPGYKGPNR
ncbi:MAG TPA: MlaD family protein [Gammaproteobacteria bacterium]|jgi:phospholipid/cholesterol/gamma-HCH transport system substrate-binding protein|nr:MlaD family protein [Gammaproteobacteria bacterium]